MGYPHICGCCGKQLGQPLYSPLTGNIEGYELPGILNITLTILRHSESRDFCSLSCMDKWIKEKLANHTDQWR